MSVPNQASTRFTEHEKYAEFLASLNRVELATYLEKHDDDKVNQFFGWLEDMETAADFKNLIPMHIRMSAEEFAWFKAKIDAEDEENIPNLKALSDQPPHGAI